MDTLSTVAEAANGLGKMNVDIGNVGSDAFIITVMGWGIVFAALVILSVFMTYFSKILKINLKKRLAASGSDKQHEDHELDISGEVNAAISMALFKHFEEIHDMENTVITIQKVQRPYSPWSSKIYGLRQNPRN